MSLSNLTSEILKFRNERDWAVFHTPRNLSSAIAIEAAELQEVLLWKGDEEISALIASKPGHSKLSDEAADVLIYTLLFCNAAGIDPEAAVRIKLKKNGQKYPVEKSRGSAKKYSEL